MRLSRQDYQHAPSYLEILFWPSFELLGRDENGWERADFFLRQPRILHLLVAKEKEYNPWENNMAYLNFKGIGLKTSIHMLLAGEDKDVMKIRKGGKKNSCLSFSKRVLLSQHGFTCNSENQLLRSFREDILVGWSLV